MPDSPDPPSTASHDPVPSFLSIDAGAAGRPMDELIRTFDWSTTPLGAMPLWPASLRATVATILSSPVAIVLLCGADGVMIYNDAYSVFAGGRHPRLLGSKVRDGWPEVADFNDHVMRVGFAGGTLSFRDQQLALHRHGYPEDVWMDLSYGPIRDEHGTPTGVLAVVVETTDRVKGERRLRTLRDLGVRTADAHTMDEACERALEAVAANPDDFPFALVYRVEPDARRVRRVAAASLVDEASAPLLLSLDDPDAAWPAGASIDSGATQDVERLADRFGVRPGTPWPERSSRAVVLPIRVARDHATETWGVLVVGLARRQPPSADYRAFLEAVAGRLAASIAAAAARESERRRAEELEALDRAKTAFFSNVSHEFRTPLTLMLGPLDQVLDDGSLPAAVREPLARAHRNALRLQRLVNSLLEFSRIEAGRTRAAVAPVDLAALTRDLASTFRAAIERAGLAFDVDCPPLDAPVAVDREMWERIVLNLLSNAFKYTLAGRIAVRLRRERGDAVLDVADTGTGIPPDEVPRLFQRFHRVEGARGRSAEGSGIGLALVQELVRMHGGRVEVESAPGRGSTFRVRIPAGAASAVSEATPQSGPASSAVARVYAEEALGWLPETSRPAPIARDAHTPPPRDRRFAATFGARIVVADDNPDLQSYLRELLAPCYAVETVGDGEAALAAVRRDPPALVVTDVMMPRLDGLQLIAALRSDALLQRIPVLMLSARAGEEARIEGLGAGADDYLVKPFSARELLARVGALLERDLVRRAGEDRLTRAFQAAPAFVAILDGPRHRYVFVNDAMEQVFGRRGTLGRTVREAFPELESQGVFETLDRVYATGERYVAEEARYRFDATPDLPPRELYLDFIYEPLRDELGRVTGIFVHGTDVTARRRASDALKDADRQKDEFLAMLAHELRNPLAPLRNAGELLARTVTHDGHAQSAVAMLRRQVTQLTRMVDDLLDVSRITRGRIELQRRTVRLAAIVADAVEAVEPLAREKRHELSVVVEDTELAVDGDHERLVQCTVNLLTNAVKYTDPGGHIRIRSFARGDAGIVEVSDDGSGIAPDLLPNVFDLFVQSQRTLDRAQGGLGIGLAVVKRLVEMHGGHVRARSDGPQRGTTLTIELPRVAPHADAANHVGRTRTTAPRRILVVDDNVDAADSLAMVLRMDGHDVQAAYSGREALERARTSPPEIVLLDIGLPEMDGYEVARRLRELASMRGALLVALTGYGQPEDRRRAQRAGFAAHFVKPVDFDRLGRLFAAD